MSSITERARDFWDRISPRERVMVLALGVAAPIVLAVWLGMNISDGLAAKEKSNQQMRKALVVLADLKARGLETTAGDNIVDTMGTEPLSLDSYLDEAAKTAGFTLKGTTPRPPVPKNGFVTTTVQCAVSDLSIDQLRKFLQEIETKSKLVMITKLEVKRSFKDKEKLNATLEVSTYSKEAPAKKDGAGSGSAEKKT